MLTLRRLMPFLPLLVLAAVVASCGDRAASVPTAPTAVRDTTANSVEPAPSTTVGPQSESESGCYTVRFHATKTGPGTAPFTLSGDLEGSVKLTFAAATGFFAGVTYHAEGTALWTITGGMVPGLTTFQTSVQQVHFPGKDTEQSPSYVYEFNGTHRALTGVAKANLSYRGTAELAPLPRWFDHEYWGVICP